MLKIRACGAHKVFYVFFTRLELEDLEMKNNSAIKQLMREFNTQMALRETELDTAVKETIGEAAEYKSPFTKLK